MQFIFLGNVIKPREHLKALVRLLASRLKMHFYFFMRSYIAIAFNLVRKMYVNLKFVAIEYNAWINTHSQCPGCT